jgi:enoyl-CoA hydratase/carnithine racemase
MRPGRRGNLLPLLRTNADQPGQREGVRRADLTSEQDRDQIPALARLLGRGRAMEAVLGADDFDAETAERYGWINRGLPDADLDAFVARLAAATGAPDSRTRPPATLRSPSPSTEDHDRDRRQTGTGPPIRDRSSETPDRQRGREVTGPDFRAARTQVNQARMAARRLAAAGKPVSRRGLRSSGVTGSNERLNVLARMIKSEMAGSAPPHARAGRQHAECPRDPRRTGTLLPRRGLRGS